MLNHKTGRLFSASDLVNFLGCRYRTVLDLENLEAPRKKAEDDDHAKLIQQKGLRHEASYLDHLRAQGNSIVEIAESGSLDEKLSRTRAAMEAGADVIFQATLSRGAWHGYADFLQRVEKPSGLCDFSYEVLDTKLKKTSVPSHVIQLGVYSWMLEQVQGHLPQFMQVVLGGKAVDGNFHIETFRCQNYGSYINRSRLAFESFLLAPPTDVNAEPCQHCEHCPWSEDCASHWRDIDHLSFVANIQESQIAKLGASEQNIKTLAQLGDLPEGSDIRNLNSDTLFRIRNQARMQLEKRRTDENKVEVLDISSDHGFVLLPKDADGDLFFDMEGDPLYDAEPEFDDGLEYLFGFYFIEAGEGVFKTFWGHNRQDEKRAFEGAMDFMRDHMEQHPYAHIYHYNHYEETALKRLSSVHKTRETDIDKLLHSRKLVDLFKVVRKGIRVSEPKYSIKNLEVFYMEDREGDVQSATDSIVSYEKWRESDPREQKILDDIESYNKDDCVSTMKLRDWLIELRPDGLEWFDRNSERLADKDFKKQLEKDERLKIYEKKLLSTCDETKRPLHELIFQLLDFYRREDKPKWRTYLEKLERSDEELVDDEDSLGSINWDQTVELVEENQSSIYTANFLEQRHKFKYGSRGAISLSGGGIGTITSVNNETRTIQFKRGSILGSLPETTFSIVKKDLYRSEVLQNAIFRYADSVVVGEAKFAAVTAFLNRNSPMINGIDYGTPIVETAILSSEGYLAAISTTVLNLEETTLFIQGPPGTGKTYASSHVILDLIQQGKRVAVTSNSHAAINNLLAGVAQCAKLREYSLEGRKKANSVGEEKKFFEGSLIEVYTGDDKVDDSVELLGGTAWVFSRPEYEQVFDYLFVDEAGQVSLANIVAMGLCAKNIVLIGDPMQLPQPIQGAHPGSSGLSPLEYLLETEATVAPENGIFLNMSWRMHDDICTFISDAIYGGKLVAEANNSNQSIDLTDNHHSALKPTGISFVPVDHEYRSQWCPEEADKVAEIYSDLLRQKFTDRDGILHDLTTDDILVISPYNLQVNLLTQELEDNARVGTVDKFQGQEAQVVIISMATSSEQDVSRNIEFLLSKNRLNVAVSRARSLAILIASPKLLEISCRTIEQMELANTLVSLVDYSRDGDPIMT